MSVKSTETVIGWRVRSHVFVYV